MTLIYLIANMKNYRKTFVSLFLLIILINISLAINHPKRQLRAGWIASVSNIDWPSKPGLTIAEQKAEFMKLIDEAKADNLNTLIVQIRPTADSFYPSKIFPWSQWLTGKEGIDPGYDPLKFLIEETHKANLEFHAWFNPYRPDTNKLSPEHPARKYPEWIIKYGDLLVFNPGLPEAREVVIEGILEVVTNYDVDGIHFDDYFYPYPIKDNEFPDKETYVKYGQKNFQHISDWRRNNTNILIHELHIRIKKIKPHVKFGISPFGVWRNIADDPTGSKTTALSCYDELYADTRTWIREEWIDYVVPQLYWLIGFKAAPYEVLVEWWNREVHNTSVQLYIGHAVTRVGSKTSSGWLNPHVIEDQMILNTKYSNIKGSVFWNMQHMMKNALNFRDILKSNLLSRPALIPQSIKEHENFGDSVVITKAINKGKTTTELFWNLESSAHSNMTSYFVLYRFDAIINQEPNISNADNIVALVKCDKNKTEQNFIDQNVKHYNCTYFISAVTRYHTEGILSKPFHHLSNDQ